MQRALRLWWIPEQHSKTSVDWQLWALPGNMDFTNSSILPAHGFPMTRMSRLSALTWHITKE